MNTSRSSRIRFTTCSGARGPQRRRVAFVFAFLSVLATGLIVQGDALWACDCYYDHECASGNCLVPVCSLDGKIDGVCIADGGGGDGGGGIEPAADDFFIGDDVDPLAVAGAADFYFQAYLVAVRRGEGRPDPGLLTAASDVRLGRKAHADRRNHRLLLQVVHEILDAVLGFDFQAPNALDVLLPPRRRSKRHFGGLQGSDSDPRFGGIRNVPPGAVEIVEAARSGFVEAVKSGDPDRVAAPLRAFWAKYPSYEPFHTGRYYPHGHAGEPTVPEASQIAALRARYKRLFGPSVKNRASGDRHRANGTLAALSALSCR